MPGNNMSMEKDSRLNVLEVRDLSVELGGQTILDRINIDVQQATIHAVLGPNGAGKTTLIRSLTGSLPYKGDIRFRLFNNGRIGYVPQLLEFDHTLPLTVTDFLLIMMQKKPVLFRRSKALREEVVDCLRKTSSEHLADRLIGGLSGGELRRVLLAQALTPTPEILLLDEPASNIDEVGARAFEQTLIELREEQGIAIILVGHDLATISRICDHVTGINGKITWSGPGRGLRDPEVLETIFGSEAFALNSSHEVVV
jgi:zinc transport system ATP-binding protein